MRFSKQALEYAEHAFVQRDLAAWGSEWLPPQAHDEDVLELGAGPGVFTAELLPRYGQVTATDLSPAMVEEGRSQYPHADWQVLDAWKQGRGQYDCVCSSSLLQWAPEPATVLRNMAMSLKPGGRMLHLFFTDPTLSELGRLAPAWKPFPWRKGESWRAAFNDAGLEIIRSEEQTRTVHFENARELLRFFQRTGAIRHQRACPLKVRSFIHDYERHFRNGSGVASTWTFFRIEARKADLLSF